MIQTELKGNPIGPEDLENREGSIIMAERKGKVYKAAIRWTHYAPLCEAWGDESSPPARLDKDGDPDMRLVLWVRVNFFTLGNHPLDSGKPLTLPAGVFQWAEPLPSAVL